MDRRAGVGPGSAATVHQQGDSRHRLSGRPAVGQTATITDSNANACSLYTAFDMGKEAWQFASGDGGKGRREGKIDRTDVEQGKRDLLVEIAKAKQHFGLPTDATVHAMYEAGRDGFWFARWLNDAGIKCLVVDLCCILVDRREFRNAKALGAYLGLAPTPFCSGQMNRDRQAQLARIPGAPSGRARQSDWCKVGPSKLRSLMVYRL